MPDPFRRNRWLFDTGADLYTINDAKWFKGNEYTKYTREIPVITGGGIVYPTYISRVEVSLVGLDSKKRVIVLSYTILIPKFPINIFSGERFYLAGGYLNKNKITDPTGAVVATIDVKKRGFYLYVFGASENLKGLAKAMLTSTEE